jgi:WD40 repeat protein
LWKPEKNESEEDNYNLIQTLAEHRSSVRTFCQVDRRHFASGSFDNTIKIWEIDTWKCVETLNRHNMHVIGVISLRINGKIAIASCSNDKTIKIWEKDIDTE